MCPALQSFLTKLTVIGQLPLRPSRLWDLVGSGWEVTPVGAPASAPV